MSNSSKIHIAIGLAILAFLALIGVQGFLVYNTYQLKSKEFLLKHRHQLGRDYYEYLNGGVFYNDGYILIDSLVTQFRTSVDTSWCVEDWEEARKTFFQDFLQTLHQNNTLTTFFDDYEQKHTIQGNLEYVIDLSYFYVFLDNERWVVIYDKKEQAHGTPILGTLRTFTEDNAITSERVAIGGNCSLEHTLYVDAPSQLATLLQQMQGVFLLSLFTILVILGVLVYSIRNWLCQKKLSDLKSDFINNVSHELKTPLATIAIANQSLQNEKVRQHPEMGKEMLAVIGRQNKRLQKLINQVLDINIWEKEEVSLQQEVRSIHAFLQTVIDDFRMKTADQNVQIQTRLLAQKDQVAIDAFHFTTAIYNLLDNAVKYSKGSAQIIIATNNTDQQLYLTISDKGIGMNKATQEHIFDKFYRGQKGNIHNVKGLGLGLYYVQKSIRTHGGTINVHSKKGEGSTFKITLPLTDASLDGRFARRTLR